MQIDSKAVKQLNLLGNLENIMQRTFDLQHSLQLSQWLGMGSLCSDLRGSEYRPFEPKIALEGGNPGI